MSTLFRSFHTAIGMVVLSTILSHTILHAADQVVTYEAFGARGDGVTDDMPAIRKAHEHANQHGLPVRSKPGATYHLGRRAIAAVIATDTDWSTSRFIIDDSAGVETPGKSLFDVRSLLKPEELKIDKLQRGQTKIDAALQHDCLVIVENNNRRIFIRKGENQNSGSPQKEVFILRRDGTIEGGIDWDYDQITSLRVRPIDPRPLTIRGGIFTHVANRADLNGEKWTYWGRNINISRSNTVVEGLTHRVTGEGELGQPYYGFLNATRCARITYRDCVIYGRKVYSQNKPGIQKPVNIGTAGYSANLVMDFRMIGCRQGNDIHDRSRWGVIGTGFMKNILLENCVLSRMDVHEGVSGNYIIRNSTLGHAGLNAIGRGRLIVENTKIHGPNFIGFRPDYGSSWDGEVIIRNCTWIPPQSKGRSPAIFGGYNEGTHDFGYPTSMPTTITIDGLAIDDAWNKENATPGVTFFDNVLGRPREERPFAHRLTEKVEVRNLTTTSGIAPRVSTNPEVVKAVKLVQQ